MPITQVNALGSGGSSDYRVHDVRMQGAVAPAEILAVMESQLPAQGWTTSARLGDQFQSVMRRDSRPHPETDRAELWMLTTMPQSGDIDAAMIWIETWRGARVMHLLSPPHGQRHPLP